MAAPITYTEANPLQRGVRRFASTGPGAWIFARAAQRIDEPMYRRTNGRRTFASLATGLPVVILTTTGARSGLSRTVPVLGLPTDEGLVVIASNFGQDHHPAWHHNLKAHPEGEVQVDGVRRRFRARLAEGETRDRIWREGLKIYPGWASYEKRASKRRIAVYVLDPED